MGSTSERPVPEAPMSGATIDKAKLLKAWDANVQTQRELITVVEKNEKDNEKTRKTSAHTRHFVMGITLASSLFNLSLVIAVWRLVDITRDESTARIEQVHEKVHRIEVQVNATQAAQAAAFEALITQKEHALEVVPNPDVEQRISEAKASIAVAKATTAQTQARKQDAVREYVKAKRKAPKAVKVQLPKELEPLERKAEAEQ